MSNIFFGSDYHFGHKNIIKYCNRPFDNIEEMDEQMIERHNKKVKPEDTVYLIGDIAFAKPQRIGEILDRLNGKKILVPGNHDEKIVGDSIKKIPPNQELMEKFECIEKYLEIKIGGKRICMFHFPIMSWHKMHRNSWHLHGHSHGKLPDKGGLIKDVGIDTSPDYTAFHWDEIVEFMKLRTFIASGDHHKSGR